MDNTSDQTALDAAPLRSEALLAAIIDSSDDAIVSKDINGIVMSWNPAAERLFQYRATEMIGQSITKIIPKERLSEETMILTRIREGLRIEHFETERIRKDGTRVEVSLTISPVRNAAGQIVGASKIARDVASRKQARQALERSERLLNDFFESTPIPFQWVAKDGSILRANQATYLLLGYAPEECIGRHIEMFLEPESHAAELFADVISGQQIDDQHVRLRRKDGSVIQVLLSSNGYWENGKFVHSRCFMRDITAQKKADATINETFRELNRLKTALDEHAIVAITDARGKITYVNDKFCAISQYSRQELLGQDHRIINSGYHSKEFIRDLWQTIRSGKVWKGEIKNRAKDGSFYWVDTTIVPYVDERGRPTQFVAIRADITARKLVEEKLRESEIRFRTMADAAPVLIWVADAQMLCTYFNQVWLDFVGRPMDRELGNGWIENIHPDDYERCVQTYSAAYESRRPFEMEYRMLHHSGEYRWILDRGVPRFGPNGSFQGYIGGCTEIDAQKSAEERLERQVAERTAHLKESIDALNGLCYTIAHDLRAPVRAIHGYSEVILEDYASILGGEPERMIRRVLDSSIRMDQLISDLLEYARLSHFELAWENVELNTIFDHVITSLAQEIESKGANITVRKLPSVYAHRVLLVQVFTNLLSNALKFVSSHTTPVVEIGAESIEGWERIWIQDNGIGIKPEHRENVFEVFQRLHLTENEYPGTGIGLAIVKKGMERMGGRVTIAPEIVNGTRFLLDFPPAPKGSTRDKAVRAHLR